MLAIMQRASDMLNYDTRPWNELRKEARDYLATACRISGGPGEHAYICLRAVAILHNPHIGAQLACESAGWVLLDYLYELHAGNPFMAQTEHPASNPMPHASVLALDQAHNPQKA